MSILWYEQYFWQKKRQNRANMCRIFTLFGLFEKWVLNVYDNHHVNKSCNDHYGIVRFIYDKAKFKGIYSYIISITIWGRNKENITYWQLINDISRAVKASEIVYCILTVSLESLCIHTELIHLHNEKMMWPVKVFGHAYSGEYRLRNN